MRISDWSSDVCSSDLKKRNEQANDITVGTIGEPRRGVIRKSNGGRSIRPDKEGGANVGIQKTVSRLARAGAIGLIGAVLAAGPASAQPKRVPVLSCPSGWGPIPADPIPMTQINLSGFQVVLLPPETTDHTNK